MKLLSIFASIDDIYEKKSGNHVLKFMICGWQGLTFISANRFLCTPNSLIDSTKSPKVKIMQRGVGVHSLTRSTLGVEGCVGVLGCELGGMASELIIHIGLHKPKLVNA
jgi:hypothetical protein